jgi:dTDP-6-deoxy-L-talose 4-dehydrogenase (NAD+)
MGWNVCYGDPQVGDNVKIAVTGANGFIGRHVLAELKRRSVDCVAVDLHLPDDDESLDVFWVKLDIHQPLPKVFDAIGRPDACIHLAWGGLPNYKSLHHLEKEVPGQYRFLSSLVREGLSSLVVAGTCLEYGVQTGVLCEDIETHPATPYGLAKDALRRQLQFLREDTPFAFTWARLFYVFGEGQSSNSLWPQLKQAVQRGDKIFPMSGGEQLRDYLPVETVAERLVSLALAKVDAGVVNICSGEPVSVRHLVEGWISGEGWKIKLDLGRYPYPDHEPMEFWGDRRYLDKLTRNFPGR